MDAIRPSSASVVDRIPQLEMMGNPLGPHGESALVLLLNALEKAQDLHCSVWDFAVELFCLRRLEVTRSDLRWLVAKGYAGNMQDAFARYLIPCDVPKRYFPVDEALATVHRLGGVAVLAHPGRYMTGRSGMGKKTMQELLTEFVELGGLALEVVTGSHTPEQYAEFARYAEEFNLLASCGSDFHGPGESYRDMGRLPDFPLGCRPVWEAWENDELVKLA